MFLSILSLPAFAQHRHHYHRNHNHNYVVPALIIGGIFGAAVANAYERPPVIIQQPQNFYYPTETVIINGQIYTKQLVIVDGVYREVLIRR